MSIDLLHQKIHFILFWRPVVGRISSWHSPFVVHYVTGQVLCIADCSLISWFSTTFNSSTELHGELAVVSCFYRSPAAGITKQAHLNMSVTLYLSSPDLRHNAKMSRLWQLNWHLLVIMWLLWISWKIAIHLILLLQIWIGRNHHLSHVLIWCGCLSPMYSKCGIKKNLCFFQLN